MYFNFYNENNFVVVNKHKTPELLEKLQALQDCRTDDMRAVYISIELKSKFMYVRISADVKTQWNGWSTREIIWVGGKANHEFVDQVVDYFNSWKDMPLTDQRAFHIPQKHHYVFKDGVLVDPLIDLIRNPRPGSMWEFKNKEGKSILPKSNFESNDGA
jgi:hypothetical protein